MKNVCVTCDGGLSGCQKGAAEPQEACGSRPANAGTWKVPVLRWMGWIRCCLRSALRRKAYSAQRRMRPTRCPPRHRLRLLLWGQKARRPRSLREWATARPARTAP